MSCVFVMDVIEFDKNYSLEERHWWFKGRRAILREILSSLNLNDGTKIMEVGCGTGGNLPMLKEYGDVDAVEYSPYALKFAREKNTDLDIVEGGLPDRLPFRENVYDVVCAFDVLEHVDDDVLSVSALTQMLKQGGYIFCTVPAYMWMWSRHDNVNGHKRRYVLNEFESLFSANKDLEIVHSSYFNTLLFPIAAIVRIIGFLRSDNESDLKEQSEFVNHLLTRIFSSEKKIVAGHRVPYGLSCLCLARKISH